MKTQDDPLIGKVFGRYTVLRRIAGGGQSSIYEARSDAGPAAIKFLHAVRERSPESSERLRREALALQRLHHPNVVRLLDYGEAPDGNPWLAMELLEGESLAMLLTRAGTLTEGEIISVLAPICEALQEAHKNGIIHRDLKPQNIMLVREGGARVPKLLDFGIAMLRDADALTSSITLRGTPKYMAPEQWEGLKRADPRSDVYSLGVITYQALSGKDTFAADTPLSWMKKAQLETPLDLALAVGGRPVHPAFCMAVMNALAKDPEQRPQTPMDFLRALRPALPPPSSAASRPWFWSWVFALIAGLIGGTVGFFASRAANTKPVIHPGPPIVVLIDTPVAHGVYDEEVARRGGTNADTLSDLLRDLPIRIEKESVPSTWNREQNVLETQADAIVVHRSAFFHPLNVEFGFGYEPFPDEVTKTRWNLLYRIADDKLVAFLGLVGTVNPQTKFLVYSRGTGTGWLDPADRGKWVTNTEQRFPALRGRVSTMVIEGGVERGSFKNPAVAEQMRRSLQLILAIAGH